MYLDLEYWNTEKNCSCCGMINHWTRDCPYINNPSKKYTVIHKHKIFGYMRGRTKYEALVKAQTHFRKLIPWNEIVLKECEDDC